MADVQLARCEIKPGKEDELREWYDALEHERFEETAATLISEGTLTESAFIQTSENGPSYLYVVMETTDADEPRTADAEEQQIDADHHDVLAETLVGKEWEEFESIAHLVHPER